MENSLFIKNGLSPLAAKLNIVSRTAPLIVLVHGFAGNMDENGLFRDATIFFGSKGLSVLRFDFRGCGESPGAFRDVRLKHLKSDLKSVLQFVRSHESHVQPSSVNLIAFSLGAAVSILVNPRLSNAHIYWSPAIFTATDMYPRYQTRDVLDQIKEKGFFVKAGLEVGKDFMKDLLKNDIEFNIRNISVPVLLVHGEKDDRIPPASSRQATKLFKSAEMRLLPDADHAFRNISREHLFDQTIAWLTPHLESSPNSTRRDPLRRKSDIAPKVYEPVLAD